MQSSRAHQAASCRGRGATRGVLLALGVSWCAYSQEIVAPPASVPRELLNQGPIDGYRLGIFDLYPRLSARGVFSDNIFASSMIEEADFIWSASPGAVLSLGDRGSVGKALALDYTPSLVFFTDNTEFNTIDHSVRFSGTLPFARLTLGFGQDFDVNSSAVLGLADRVQHRCLESRLIARYDVGEKTSLEVKFRQTVTRYQRHGFIDSRERCADSGLNYQALPKLNVGAALAGGHLELERNPDQFYGRFSFRGVFAASTKLDLNASAGAESREYGGTGRPNNYPVVSVGARYQPTATTAFLLNGSLTERNSAYLSGENYASTAVSASMRQVLCERFQFTLGACYDNLDFHFTQPGFSHTRSDNQLTLSPGLDWMIRRNWRVGVFYSYRTSISSDELYEYDNNQAGVHTAWFF